jgi:hypothetical protein
MLMLGAPAAARAQMYEPLRFTTPFAFQAGKRLLPAGTYLLAPLNDTNGGNLFMLSSRTAHATFVMGDGLGVRPGAKAKTDEVIFAFDHATGHYVMCQVWDEGERSGIQIHGTYDLMQAARAAQGNAPNQPEIVPVPAVR